MVDLSGMGHLTGKRVVMTGATGFIGKRVMAIMITCGVEVTALVRHQRGVETVQAAGATPKLVPLTDQSGLSKALTGADALIHLAYDVRASAAANLKVFNTLIEAAEAAQVGRIIQTSSVVVYDDWPTAGLDANSPVKREGGSPYRQAKMTMEERLLNGTIPAAVLQPTLVYGPGSALWTDGFAEALASGGIVLPEPEGLCNAVYVDDVALSVLCALGVSDLGQERFLISGPEPIKWTALLGGYSNIVGGDIIRVPAAEIAAQLGPEPEMQDTPSLAAKISAAGRRLVGNDRFDAVVSGAKRLLGRSGGTGPLHPDHHLFGVFTAQSNCRIDAARERLGYIPQFDLEAGLEMTAPYLKQKFGQSS